MQAQNIKLKDLQPNRGQVEGLPKNPRFIRDEKFAKLVKSIKDDPEMLDLRELIAYDAPCGLVIICGNMRYRAMKELGLESAPVKVLPADTPPHKLRAYAMKDNNAFGENDWDIMADWDFEELEDWGFDIPSDFGGTADISTKPTTEQPQKRKGWNTEAGAKESVCDLADRLALYKRGDVLFTAFFKKSQEGVPLSLIKTEDNVQMFAEKIASVIRGLIGFRVTNGWSIITTPKRRHKDWNFSEEVCKAASNLLGIPFHANAVEAKNRQRINPEFKLNYPIEEDNVIVFDDILTTGSTVKAMGALLVNKNTVFLIGINNN